MKTKLCGNCNHPKPIREFSKRGNGLQPWCNDCKRTYNREYHAGRKVKHAENKRSRRNALRQKLRDLKITLVCKTCGEKHPSCLEFHHRDPNTKEFNIGTAIGKLWSWDRIQAEIDKCDVLCSNCHRKFHWDEDHDINK